MQEQILGALRIPILCDNQSAMCIAKNGTYNPRTKHVDIRYHFVHEALDQGAVDLRYVNTKDQAADGFTKPLTQSKMMIQKQLIGIED